jgi:hypothetical protein
MTAGSTRNRTWVIVLVIVALLFLCCCLILVAGWFLGDPILEYLRRLGYDINICLPLLR